jgi:hypothetical protein
MTAIPTVAIVCAVSAAVAGLLFALAPRLILQLTARLAFRDVQATSISILLSAAVVAMLPVAGFLTDTFGVRPVLSTGSLLAAIAIAFVALTRSLAGAILGALLLANSTACLWTSSVTLMPAAFPTTYLPAAVNLGFVFAGLGTLLSHSFATGLARYLSERRVLGVFALLCLAPALLAAVADVEAFPAPAANGSWHTIPGRPEFWLIALGLALCAPIEQAMGAWATRYLGEAGHPVLRAAWLMVAFWATFLAGRLVLGMIGESVEMRPKHGPWLVLVLAIVAAICLGNLAGSRGLRAPTVALLVVAGIIGPLFPTLVGLLFERFPASLWGSAFGAAAAAAFLSTRLLLPVLEGYVQRNGARPSVWLYAVGMLGLALVMLMLGVARTAPIDR